MVLPGTHDNALDMSFTNTKKLTPGPYRATKMWNEIVRHFRENMQCKKHRRHLRTYGDCFSAAESIDFLHQLLRTNSNIGKDVTRQQTIQLLRKFLRNHVIEDVHGRWGSENFNDDGHLFRFPPGISTAQALRQPLGSLDDNIPVRSKKTSSKKAKRKTIKETIPKEKENTNVNGGAETEKLPTIKTLASTSSTSFDRLKRPLPPVPTIPKCRVISQKITDSSVKEVWKSVLLGKLKSVLQLDTLDEILVEEEIKGKHVQHNATRIGRSGVVQVDKDEDLPYWALSAMTCLANWPNSKDTGLPCYPGFEKDVFKAVCDYYVGFESVPTKNNNTMRRIPEILPEPLLTYELYELFTNILCLLQPEKEDVAVEALRYSLLLLPSANRRKLHLLLRLMSKMCVNPHLETLGEHVSTRTLLLQKFSRYILSCNEEVYLDELIAMRLVSFLIDNHAEVLKVPSDIESSVQERIESMRRPNIRYGESGEEGPYTNYTFVGNNGVRSRLRSKGHNHQATRNKRKSTDLMKSWDRLVTTIRHKPTTSSGVYKSDTSDSDSYTNVAAHEHLLRHKQQRHRPRTQTIASRMFRTGNSSPQPPQPIPTPDLNESRMKPAKSCSDIFDLKISPTTRLPQKSSELVSSSWNLRLRPSTVFGRPFSKLKKSKV